MQETNENRVPEKKSFSVTAVITIVIILFLIVASIFWLSKSPAQEPSDIQGFEELTRQSDSDELESIEVDIELSDFDDLDAELRQMEKELRF